MSSFKINARELVRLAKEDKLSLELRLQWLKKFGYDPYNKLCQTLLIKNVVTMTLVAVFLVGCGVAAEGYLWRHVFNPEYIKSQHAVVFSIFWMLAVCALIVCIAVLSIRNPEALYKGNAFCKNLSRVLECLAFENDKLLQTAEIIASWDLVELRSRAKEVVIAAAERVLEHESVNRKSEVDSSWHSTKAKLDENFTETFASFELFNLVHGGYDYFFAEARKRLAEKPTTAAA